MSSRSRIKDGGVIIPGDEEPGDWKRLEGGAIDDNLEEGLEARIADPLWLLAKQWQVGEFHGEDAATPMFIETEIEATPITHFRAGEPAAQNPVYRRDQIDVPLETFVEREAVENDDAFYRLNAEAGMLLLRVVSSVITTGHVRRLIRNLYPLELPGNEKSTSILEQDKRGYSELKLLTKKSVDAAKIIQDIEAAGDAESWLRDKTKSTSGNGTISTVAKLVEQWKTSWQQMFSVPDKSDGGCWDSKRMEYRFQVGAGVKETELQLDATEYYDGRLDWDDFNLNASPKFPLGVEDKAVRRTLKVLPGMVKYAGMPASRWWELEDNEVWFGDIDTAPEDLARSVVAGFATVYSDDWFLVPCTLKLGTMARVKKLIVHDNFGETHKVRSCAEYDGKDREWRFFEITGDASADAEKLKDRQCPWVLLPPVIHDSLNSGALETVKFIRDEASNLVWGVEATIQSPSGRRVDRQSAWRAKAKEKKLATEKAWHYLLASEVPDHFVPLVPVRNNADGSILFQRGRMADASVKGEVITTGALGKVLEPDRALLIHEEEIPTTGMRVQRHWQLARDPNGKSYLWMARRKGAIDHKRNTALYFDDLITKTE